VPTYPNVPNAPGVPPLLRQIGAIENTVSLVLSDALIILNMFLPTQWGIFDANSLPVLTPDTVLEVATRKEYLVSNAPQEAGSFLSYNKVEQPYDLRVSMAIAGNVIDRSDFLQDLAGVAKALDLVTVITPEIAYPNLNVSHFDYRRTQKNGAYILIVDVWLIEIRQVGAPTFTNTATPAGAAQVNGGTVAPQTPPASQASSSGLLGGGV
jgi:hypothetical protein